MQSMCKENILDYEQKKNPLKMKGKKTENNLDSVR